MRSSITVVGCLATLWGEIGSLLAHLPLWGLWMPAYLCLQVARASLRYLPPDPVPDPAESRRRRRLVGIWTAAEGVGIIIGLIIAFNLGDDHAVMPVIAIAVGLHFIPLARYLPKPSYYFTGIFITAAGLIGLALPAPLAGICTAFAGCIILLFTMMLIALDAPRLVAG
jgi:hypothetical protein